MLDRQKVPAGITASQMEAISDLPGTSGPEDLHARLADFSQWKSLLAR